MSARLLCGALLLVVIAAFKVPASSKGEEEKNSSQETRWEYHVQRLEGFHCATDNSESLNKLGHVGWELVSYAPVSVAFPKEAEGALLMRPAATGPGKANNPQTADSFTGTMTIKLAPSRVDGCQLIFKRPWHPNPEQPQ